LRSRWIIALLASLLLGFFAEGARAQVDLFSSEAVHGVADLRLSAADGEPSFTDGGFGKARYGGAGGGGYQARLQIAEAALEYTPRLSWDWSAVVDIGYQPGQEHAVDLYQAYLAFKPVPRSATTFSARAGLFYPPISLEHDARVWGLTNMITPSAINSWVGEELKVVGVEGAVTHDFGGSSLAVTGAVFGYDDTSGTLLTFRGWALHDLKSQVHGDFDLPPLSPLDSLVQSPSTYPTLEIDHRLGYYAKAAWRPRAPFSLEALYYNNRGDGVALTDDLQWAWETHFTSLGAAFSLDDHNRFVVQAVDGRTLFGATQHRLVDVSFRSAFVLFSHDLGRGVLSARGDVFETEDNAPLPPAPNSEHGWALTGAWRYPLNDHLDLRLEAMRIESTRPARVLAGEAPRQVQDVLQSSLRLTF
jgi:hypothetical protein